MFIAIGLFISVFAIAEVFSNKNREFNFVYYLIVAGLTFLLCFRYGQGTDYHAYEQQYDSILVSNDIFTNQLFHGEIGWFILMLFSKRIGLNFYWFVGIVSFAMMFLVTRSIKRHSPKKLFSVLLLYPTFYLTYFTSAMRQGLVLSLFVGIGLELLIKKRTIKYLILIAFLSVIHFSSIVLILLPIVLRLKNKKIIYSGIFLSVVVFILGYFGALNSIGGKLGISSYFTNTFSFMAFALRLCSFAVICFLHNKYNKVSNVKEGLEPVLFRIYTFGFIAYLALSFSGNLSQRLTMPLKAVEILLFPILISNLTISFDKTVSILIRNKTVFITFVSLTMIVILNTELIKNINSYLYQGNYFSSVNVFTYPWISVFDKNRIWNYISHFDL